MAYSSSDNYGEVTVRSSSEGWVHLSIGGGSLAMRVEEAEKVHAQMGELIAEIKARQAALQAVAA